VVSLLHLGSLGRGRLGRGRGRRWIGSRSLRRARGRAAANSPFQAAPLRLSNGTRRAITAPHDAFGHSGQRPAEQTGLQQEVGAAALAATRALCQRRARCSAASASAAEETLLSQQTLRPVRPARGRSGTVAREAASASASFRWQPYVLLPRRWAATWFRVLKSASCRRSAWRRAPRQQLEESRSSRLVLGTPAGIQRTRAAQTRARAAGLCRLTSATSAAARCSSDDTIAACSCNLLQHALRTGPACSNCFIMVAFGRGSPLPPLPAHGGRWRSVQQGQTAPAVR
jgi:hypothetical protein